MNWYNNVTQLLCRQLNAAVFFKQKVASAELNAKTLPAMFKALEDFIQPNFTKHGVVYGSKVSVIKCY